MHALARTQVRILRTLKSYLQPAYMQTLGVRYYMADLGVHVKSLFNVVDLSPEVCIFFFYSQKTTNTYC